MMYYNDNAVWPRFLKFLRYYISYTYMNSERGILRRYKYVALFRIIYQRRVTVYSFINPLLLLSLYYIVSFDDRENWTYGSSSSCLSTLSFVTRGFPRSQRITYETVNCRNARKNLERIFYFVDPSSSLWSTRSRVLLPRSVIYRAKFASRGFSSRRIYLLS